MNPLDQHVQVNGDPHIEADLGSVIGGKTRDRLYRAVRSRSEKATSGFFPSLAKIAGVAVTVVEHIPFLPGRKLLKKVLRPKAA